MLQLKYFRLDDRYKQIANKCNTYDADNDFHHELYPFAKSGIKNTDRKKQNGNANKQNIAHEILLRAAVLSACFSATVNVLPSPSALATVIVPPWASTISRAMASPSPAPDGAS